MNLIEFYQDDELKCHIIAYFFSMLTVLINSLILPGVCKKLVHVEKFETHSSYSVSLCSKLSFALFVNSALV